MLSEQEIVRRKKKETLAELGINPYPAATFVTTTSIRAILDHYEQEKANYPPVVLAGRLMSRRIMGSAAFTELKDGSGSMQLYIHRDTLCPTEDKSFYNTVFKKLLDIGDIIGVHGFVFITQVGVITLHVTQLTLLAKALHPLPVVKEVTQQTHTQVYDAFTDPELRYRRREVDLIVNPWVPKIFEQRAKIIKTIRHEFDRLGYLEVETPILQPLYGGAHARPFTTHHHALNRTLYLRIANELYLKRLIVGGYEGVYEFAKDFRNEGMSRFHNPEFTQVEVYIAYKDYYWMMDQVEKLIEKVALALHGKTQLPVGEHTLNFQRPWKRFTLFDVIHHFTGFAVSTMDEAALRKVADQLALPLSPSLSTGKILDAIFSTFCEPHLIQPTFITDYPIEMSPLAKRHRDNPLLAERFEVICNGKEICNAFSELNDPIDQRERLEAQLALGRRGDDEAMLLDEDFLRALSYGMPPTVGLGMGIDRLTMIMTNAPSIQEVIFFPQMRPESGTTAT